MEVATKEAIALIQEYYSDLDKQERLVVYLAESPIGDEYGYLTEEDWELGRGFEAFCKELGVEVWYRGSDKREKANHILALMKESGEIARAKQVTLDNYPENI